MSHTFACLSTSQTGATSDYINNDKIGTDVHGTGKLGNISDGIELRGVVGNQIVNDLVCFNRRYGILGASGSPARDNTITGDDFYVALFGVARGNGEAAESF
jgi:hypothetical protein